MKHVLFGRKQKKEFPELAVDIRTLEAGDQWIPVVQISGTVPPGSDGNDVVRVFSPNFGDSYDSPIQELRDGDFIDMNFNSLNVRLVVGKTTEKNTATAGHYL